MPGAELSDVFATSLGFRSETGGELDADLRSVIAALDEDGAERLARDLPPGLIERIAVASAAHLPSESASVRLVANDLHAEAPLTGVLAPSAARRREGPARRGHIRVHGPSRFGLSIRSVLSMAAAVGVAFVAALPFLSITPRSLETVRVPEDARRGLPALVGADGTVVGEGTPFAMAASSRNESTLVVLLQDRRDATGASASPESVTPGASAAFANLRVFPISAEPTAELTSLLDVRDTDVSDLAEEFSRIQRATDPRAAGPHHARPR